MAWKSMFTREEAERYAAQDPDYVARKLRGKWVVWSTASEHYVEIEVGDDDDEPDDRCTNPKGHSWVCSGTAYGGDDESYHGEGRCYCEWCGADGDA